MLNMFLMELVLNFLLKCIKKLEKIINELENRIDARTFHKENPELINIIKNFF